MILNQITQKNEKDVYILYGDGKFFYTGNIVRRVDLLNWKPFYGKITLEGM